MYLHCLVSIYSRDRFIKAIINIILVFYCSGYLLFSESASLLFSYYLYVCMYV